MSTVTLVTPGSPTEMADDGNRRGRARRRSSRTRGGPLAINASNEELCPSRADDTKAPRPLGTLLHSLGDVSFERIVVAPLALERFGTVFGLVLREPEAEGDSWAVEVQPGNDMAFFEPWDSGVYDT